MSKAVAQTIFVGPCNIYWGDVRMGSPMSQASFRYNKETVQAGLEDSGVNVMSHKVKETLEVDVVLADFKNHQNRYVYDQAVKFAAAPAISTIAYDASTATVIRHQEIQQLNGTTAITVDGASFLTGTIMIFKSDWSNTPDGYTRGTDWTATSSVGTVTRIEGGDIADGDTVYIDYNSTTTVSLLGLGGQMADFEGTLRIVHEDDSGKMLQFYAHRAKKIGASDIAISMADQFAGIPMTFHILANMTKPVSKQLGEWSVEA